MSIAVSIDPRSVASLNQLNSELALYGQLARKTMDEVLDKKGRDLGIQLYRSYSDHKFGPRGIAYTEMKARAAKGEGTKLRPELAARYKSARAQLTSSIRSAGQVRRQSKRLGASAGLGVYRASLSSGIDARKKRANLWNAVVKSELALRQSGAGALAASFLMFRNRTSQAEGTRQVVNRTGKVAGQVIRGNGSFSIIGYTPGLAVVDQRYGIIGRAAEAVRADMAPYIARKLAEGSAKFRYMKAA